MMSFQADSGITLRGELERLEKLQRKGERETGACELEGIALIYVF